MSEEKQRDETEHDMRKEIDGTSVEPNRRELLRKAGKVGVSATLAHFVLLGARGSKIVLAVDDDCPTAVSSDDNCNPDPNNFDYDDCQAATINSSGAPVPEVGDICGASPQNADICARPYGVADGDECTPTGSADDVAPPQGE